MRTLGKLTGAFLTAMVLSAGISAPSHAGEIKVTLLGTGSPPPQIDALGPSTLVQANGQNLLFDAGRGVTIALTQRNVPMGKIDAVFLTHHHSDHVVGLSDLLLTGWMSFPGARRAAPLKLIGPPGVEDIAKGFALAFAKDIEIRVVSNGLDPAGARITPTTFTDEQLVWNHEGVSVRSVRVDHGKGIDDAFGYLIEYDGKRVMISGDTAYNENVIKHGSGVDLLVHAVFAASDEVAATPRGAEIATHHTSPEDAARVFTKTQPKLAVFTHVALLPPNPPSREDIIKRTARGYDGWFEMGSDGMQITIADEGLSVER